MDQIALVTAALSLGIWLCLLACHGGFWRADQSLERVTPSRKSWPEIVALIPARDEADSIAAVIESHLASAYEGRYSIVLIDDHLQDGTAGIAQSIAHNASRTLVVTSAPDLVPGWTGKLWALRHGLAVADKYAPSAHYILLTDADIVHSPETLARLVHHAEQDDRVLVSLMAKLDARGLWGSLLTPAFVFFFQKLYPFPRVNRPASPTAAAAGGCILVRRSVLAQCNDFDAIRGELIDDCALARLIKRRSPARNIWLGLADDVFSLRDNRTLGSIWAMVARTAYTQLNHSPSLLVGMIIGMAVLYLAAPAALLGLPIHGSPVAAAIGTAAWLAMAAAYRPTLSYYGKPSLVALALPVSATLFLLMSLTSALQHWRGRGGAWKGRTYS